MKTYNYDLGYGPKEWLWPESDKKLFSIFEMVAEIDKWIDLCKGFDVAVQAGGAVGVWPLRLSHFFNLVHTFEPDVENFACLDGNCLADNVVKHHAALSNEKKRVSVYRLPHQQDNYGAGYIVDDSNGVMSMLVDDLLLNACDLICLDIEGAELDALKGAERTIAEHKPLIVIEDKPMPQLTHFKRDVGSCGEWLEQFGYRFVDKVHWDSIYAC